MVTRRGLEELHTELIGQAWRHQDFMQHQNHFISAFEIEEAKTAHIFTT